MVRLWSKCGPKKNGRRLFLMDNDPSHTSNAARQAMQDIEAEFDKIPTRSQDFNPVENISHLVKKNLEHEAIAKSIFSEIFKQFSERVLTSFDSLSIDVVDCTTMNRIKY